MRKKLFSIILFISIFSSNILNSGVLDFTYKLLKCSKKALECARDTAAIARDASIFLLIVGSFLAYYKIKKEASIPKKTISDPNSDSSPDPKPIENENLSEEELLTKKFNALTLNETCHAHIASQIKQYNDSSADVKYKIKSYLDFALSLPWNKSTQDNLDIEHAKKILDEHHYGMKDIKERILNFISIKKLRKDGYTPILCLVGPPGVGKTSLAKSISKCLDRAYQRIALGGLYDVSEIKGFGRTYSDSTPGQIIKAMGRAKSNNPVIVLDEIDKLSSHRGSPAGALLEALDPQQNHSFMDHYMEIPFDLSKVLFIATANSLDTIPTALRDRMEIIEISGYTQEEKLIIAKNHIVKNAIIETGLENQKLEISDEILEEIISKYAIESGVRELERQIKKLCEKSARKLVEENKIPIFTKENLDSYLGLPKYSYEPANEENKIGVCNGLAWTQHGGEILKIESLPIQGSGKLILTGQLGNVMQESANIAFSYARAYTENANFLNKNDLHIHFPAGAMPKDGPSAGISILTSIMSVLTGKPIKANYAMTGEINLSGDVMPVGGIKEKILAAKRAGIKNIILPEANKRNVKELQDIIKGINIIFVNNVNSALDHVLIK